MRAWRRLTVSDLEIRPTDGSGVDISPRVWYIEGTMKHPLPVTSIWAWRRIK
ncbi:MAG TPA: hypothetical protein QGH10_07000 [Armatimonadota bacterium]|nr:hypothetical protein [Armatimonadota bacterium]